MTDTPPMTGATETGPEGLLRLGMSPAQVRNRYHARIQQLCTDHELKSFALGWLIGGLDVAQAYDLVRELEWASRELGRPTPIPPGDNVSPISDAYKRPH